MDFEVYCDESGLEALTNKKAHLYTAIGGIWINASDRNRLKNDLSAVKSKHKINGEFKWNKVSPMSIGFYKEVLDFFFKSDFIRFRVIIIEASKVDEFKFNKSVWIRFESLFNILCCKMSLAVADGIFLNANNIRICHL